MCRYGAASTDLVPAVTPGRCPVRFPVAVLGALTILLGPQLIARFPLDSLSYDPQHAPSWLKAVEG